jgi:hypothetical protein
MNTLLSLKNTSSIFTKYCEYNIVRIIKNTYLFVVIIASTIK